MGVAMLTRPGRRSARHPDRAFIGAECDFHDGPA